MSIALYPGSFNPWHQGHEDILVKALKIFDKVVVLQSDNNTKNLTKDSSYLCLPLRYSNVEVSKFTGLLADTINKDPLKYDAVIRGLRNGHDLEYEINLQFWNEDLGVEIPFVYFITDRKHIHISSSAIREFNSLRDGI